MQPRWGRRLHPEACRQLRAMWTADTQAECERLRDEYASQLRAQGQSRAAECLERDWADIVAFCHYPREHGAHLRTSNPVESIFSGVRLRTNAAKRMRNREAALYLVFKLMERLSESWRALNGGQNLMALVLESCVFRDGIRDGLRKEGTAQPRSPSIAA